MANKVHVGNHSDIVMVFDLDGVVTDPTTTTNRINSAVIEAIAADLRSRTPVAFNTGRALRWVEDQIMSQLHGLSVSELESLLIVGEKGSIVAEFDTGKLKTIADKKLSLPESFVHDVQQLLRTDQGGWKLNEYMFWDEDKSTMGSIEKLRDKPIELKEFQVHRRVLLTGLKRLMQQHRLSDFKIDATAIATDIEHKTVGKHKGAAQVLAWLERKQIVPKQFIAFGDSPSDAAMATTFSETGTPTTFVYVGDPNKYRPPNNVKYQTVMMNGNYSADTLKHLVQLRNKRK